MGYQGVAVKCGLCGGTGMVDVPSGKLYDQPKVNQPSTEADRLKQYDALVAELKAGLEEISQDAWFVDVPASVRLNTIGRKADELLKKLEAQ